MKMPASLRLEFNDTGNLIFFGIAIDLKPFTFAVMLFSVAIVLQIGADKNS